MSYFGDLYKNEISKNLIKKFSIKNPHLVPKINKIVLNMGLGEDGSDKKLFAAAMNELSLISGRKPMYKKSKVSISNFKLRENQNIGVYVTLRGEAMYQFLERLVFLALPRIHDFYGFKRKSFDNNYNFAFGIKDHLIFSELSYDKIAKSRGMDIVFHISASSEEESCELLRSFKLPIKD